MILSKKQPTYVKSDGNGDPDPQYCVSTLTNPPNVVYTPAPLPAVALAGRFACQLTLPVAVLKAYMYISREFTYNVAELKGFTSADAATDPPV